MQTRNNGSSIKSARPAARSPAEGAAPTPSPSKKRQKVRQEAAAACPAEHSQSSLGVQPSDLLITSNSQLSYESASQSTFIEKMEGFNLMNKYSQSSAYDCDFSRGGGEDTRAGWDGPMPAIRPRLNFNSQASQDSGYSSETVAAERSRDGFDLCGGGDLSILVPSFGAGSNSSAPTDRVPRGESVFREPAEPMLIAGRGAQNPFLPPVVRKAPLFGAPPTPRDRSIFDSKFDREFTVGSGAFAEVCVARNRLEGTIYAVKRVRAVITGDRMQRRILHEVYALSVLRGCPNIVQYFDSWVDSSHLWICTELCLKETLLSFLSYGRMLSAGLRFFDQSYAESSGVPAATPRFSTVSYDEYELSQQGVSLSQRRPRPIAAGPHGLHRNLSTASNGGASLETPPPGGYSISEELAWVILESVGAALAFMHGNGIAHLDVKPGNVLIGASSYFELEALYSRLRNVTEYSREHYEHLAELEPKLISGQWKLKLGDFGNCCALDSWAKTKEEGDTRYCAEELVFSDSPDLAAADIFSLGATVYELYSGELLPDSLGSSQVWKDVRTGRLAYFDQMSSASPALSVSGDGDGCELGPESRASSGLVACIQKMMSSSEMKMRPSARELRREDWGAR